MDKEEQRSKLKKQRENLIQDLESLYRSVFDQISTLNLPEATLARLTQMILNSREGAITPLEQEIEKRVVTSAPIKNA